MEIVIKKPTIPGAGKPGCETPPVYRGKPGPQGEAGTIQIVDVVTIEPSDPARVENIGDSTNAKVILYIPKGDPGNRGEPGPDGTAGPAGHAATVEIARVVTIEPSDPARVENIGDSTNAKLILYIPKGDKGDRGEPGPAVEITDDIIQAIVGELDLTPELVGLGNVDNTADADKPVSTAQAVAIADAKKAGTDAQGVIDAHVADTNNPHGVTIEQIGAAPSGYGLGTGNAKSISSLDEITGAGWYSKWFEASELPTGAAHGNLSFYVGFYGSPKYFEIIMPVNHNYTDYSNLSLLKRRRDDSGWKPWEWEHPPMELGVVYRTTERVNGRPVFKKRFQTGYITAGAHTFAHGITSDIVGYALAGVAYVQMNDAAGANVTLYKEISNLTADVSVVAFEGCAFGNATITVAVY